jgi:hypothetical protein
MKKFLLGAALFVAFCTPAYCKYDTKANPTMPWEFVGTWCDAKNQDNSCYDIDRVGIKGFESSCDLVIAVKQRAKKTFFMHFYCKGMDDEGHIFKEMWSRKNDVLLMGNKAYRRK